MFLTVLKGRPQWVQTEILLSPLSSVSPLLFIAARLNPVCDVEKLAHHFWHFNLSSPQTDAGWFRPK